MTFVALTPTRIENYRTKILLDLCKNVNNFPFSIHTQMPKFSVKIFFRPEIAFADLTILMAQIRHQKQKASFLASLINVLEQQIGHSLFVH